MTGLLAISQHPERRMLAWAWQGYAQARAALEQARDRQVELKQALEDLALANRETIRLNEMLSAARRAVEEARRAKEEFVANVSHELRTPLNMIIGFSDMILDAPETYSHRLPSALLADVAAIRRNSQHLSELVDDVLDLSEADSGSMQLFKERVSLAEVIQEAKDTVGGFFEKKGLTLNVDVPPDLPPMQCDRTRIRQVLLNLLSNAARFTERGGATIRAWVEGQMVTISVADTGLGMAADKVEKLFEPFQQGDPSIRRRFGGSGLGLAISKRLVEMHGGRIWLESKMGEGTTASFSLPLNGDWDTSDSRRWFGEYQAYVPRPRVASLPPLRAKPRVVVVEEGSVLSGLIERYAEDIEPVVVRTLDEAAYAVEANAASALVVNDALDAGAEILARLPRMGFNVPILSCWVPERSAASAKLGVQGYLVKPVSRSALFRAIEQVAPEARTIVLADDDAEARRLFGRILASAERSYVVLHARDGERTLDLLRTRKPDLLLLDLIMPNMDGFEVLRVMRREPALASIPVIVLSAKDPEREPLISRSLMLSRQDGLSPRDLINALQAIVHTLKPRFGEPKPQ
ncbi:MAG: hybrid sensor histidine kinase/response regulator [Chloroflexi bacterium]|nr:hybrid sensor histidine kinase/response regulator [Chloroflexota bacterium]